MLDISNGQVEAELKVIIKWNRAVRPVVSFVVSTRPANKNQVLI